MDIGLRRWRAGCGEGCRRLSSECPRPGDLIAGTDLQSHGLPDTYGVTVDSAGNIALNQIPVTLPQHCLKS